MKDHCLGEISKRRDAQPRYAVKIQHIVDAIVAAGYVSLDSQAKRSVSNEAPHGL